MKFICSLITVENISNSKLFYEDVMKQKIKYDFGENVLFEGGFAIHLKSHYSKLINHKPIISASNNFELYFEFDDVDFFVKELKNNKIEFIHEIKEQPWRQKVVRFYDPDKNIIEVGESLEFLSFRLSKEGKSVENISKIIGLPIDFVIESIQKMKSAGHSE
jgi:predicted enzyme related to lactoylglutathione lyase